MNTMSSTFPSWCLMVEVVQEVREILKQVNKLFLVEPEWQVRGGAKREISARSDTKWLEDVGDFFSNGPFVTRILGGIWWYELIPIFEKAASCNVGQHHIAVYVMFEHCVLHVYCTFSLWETWLKHHDQQILSGGEQRSYKTPLAVWCSMVFPLYHHGFFAMGFWPVVTCNKPQLRLQDQLWGADVPTVFRWDSRQPHGLMVQLLEPQTVLRFSKDVPHLRQMIPNSYFLSVRYHLSVMKQI